MGISKKNPELVNKLTVPTHMWTEFVCYNPDKTIRVLEEKVVSRMSFIGLNYRTGVVKLYEQGITETLKKMYQASKLGSFTPGPTMEMAKNMKKGISKDVKFPKKTN